jgi:amidase
MKIEVTELVDQGFNVVNKVPKSTLAMLKPVSAK